MKDSNGFGTLKAKQNVMSESQSLNLYIVKCFLLVFYSFKKNSQPTLNSRQEQINPTNSNAVLIVEEGVKWRDPD